MAEFPALPLWTDAYLADTTHLSTTEHGAYMLVLIAMWRSPTCSLPDDDLLLARISRCGKARWANQIRPALTPFFIIADGRWTQKRLTKERAFVRRKSAVASENARRKWLKTNEPSDADAYASGMPNGCSHTHTQDIIPPVHPSDVHPPLSGGEPETPQPSLALVPAEPDPEPPPKPKRAANGTRIPDDFAPDLTIALAEGFSHDQAEREAANFVDYWTAAAGQRARKADWPATWRVWVRKAGERIPGPRLGNGHGAAGPRRGSLAEAGARVLARIERMEHEH